MKYPNWYSLIFILIMMGTLGCPDTTEEADEDNFVPGILLVGFQSDVTHDSAHVVLNEIGYVITDMNFSMSFNSYSNNTDQIKAVLLKSPYVVQYIVIQQPIIMADGIEIYPIVFWTRGVIAVDYYFDLLKPFIGENKGRLLKHGGSAMIKVPVGHELKIAEEIAYHPAIAYAEPDYYFSFTEVL